jgi:hypothetical protein
MDDIMKVHQVPSSSNNIPIRGEGVIGSPIGVGTNQLTLFSFLLGRTSLFPTGEQKMHSQTDFPATRFCA